MQGQQNGKYTERHGQQNFKKNLWNLNVGGTGSATGASGVQVNEKWSSSDAVRCVAQCQRDSDIIINKEDRIFMSQLILEYMQRHADVVNLNSI
jgi:hypothetical protein